MNRRSKEARDPRDEETHQQGIVVAGPWLRPGGGEEAAATPLVGGSVALPQGCH